MGIILPKKTCNSVKKVVPLHTTKKRQSMFVSLGKNTDSIASYTSFLAVEKCAFVS